MHPVLLTTPWFNIYSYGFMLSIGYSVAMALAMYHGKNNGLNPETIFDLMLLQLIVGIAGSRLLFIMEYAPSKLFTLDLLALEQGGMTFYGSVITGFVFDLIFLKLKKMPFWKTMDCIGFSMGPAIAISRIGCFLNGCCYGTPCSEKIGFQFSAPGPGYYHATQIYESFLAIIAFFIILGFKKRQTHEGQIFLGFIGLYGFFRFFIEFLRAENPIFLFGMTMSQILSLVFIAIGIVVWKFNLKNKNLLIMPNTEEKILNGK